jgi:hypothetical protein
MLVGSTTFTGGNQSHIASERGESPSQKPPAVSNRMKIIRKSTFGDGVVLEWVFTVIAFAISVSGVESLKIKQTACSLGFSTEQIDPQLRNGVLGAQRPGQWCWQRSGESAS